MRKGGGAMWQVVMLLAVAGSGLAQGRNSTSITSSSAAPSSTATAPTASPTSASSSGTPKTTVITRDPIPVNYYPSRRERPPKDKEESSVHIPTGGSPKPTKYHYYPHNQHIYLLPECAVQQVCNAVYVRLNYTQPLCACPSRYREPCSASLNSDDLHTTELSASPYGKVFTLVKTCEPVADMRLCRAPRDWSLLALQNIRTGKSHYLVICRCPYTSTLEGPMSHDQPTYASVPGIRVYGMMCISKNFSPSTTPLSITKRKSRPMRVARSLRFTNYDVPFPWDKVKELMKSTEV